MMHDYSGSLTRYQQKLDDNGIKFDVTSLAGATQREIQAYVNYLLKGSQNNVNVTISN